MTVSLANSGVVHDALKKCGVGLVSARPETWLVHLIRMAEDIFDDALRSNDLTSIVAKVEAAGPKGIRNGIGIAGKSVSVQAVYRKTRQAFNIIA
ncbi:MAG TPA: hypothetical protein VN872_11780 [Candidatus Acidoferrum sp.]|nr:hypothetical protein [Candidatus Acidoferrum sp.]